MSPLHQSSRKEETGYRDTTPNQGLDYDVVAHQQRYRGRNTDDIDYDDSHTEKEQDDSGGTWPGGKEPLHEVPMGEGPTAPQAATDLISADPLRRTSEISVESKGLSERGVHVDVEGKPKEVFQPAGTKAWLNLLGAFLMNSICYGMTNSFGVFQSYYVSDQLPTNTATEIAWIGSVQLCLCPLLGCFSGPLFDSGYLRHLIITGGTLYVFSMMMASISKVYWQYLLSHGIGVGLGMGIMFSPSVSTISHHFALTKYRSMAYGIQATGSCFGGILFPILARNLFSTVGFDWTVRIFGFIVLAIMVVIYFTLSAVHPPRKKIAILSPSVFGNMGYAFHVAGASLCSMAIYCPLTFSVTYGLANGVSPSLSNYSLAIINAASAFGRITPLIAARWVGFINIHATFAITSAIMLFVWTTAKSVPGVLVYDAMYGISSGAYAAAFNAAAASFSPHPNQVGLYIGMAFFVTSFFWGTGVPATAALIRGDNYLPASMFCGAVVMGGGGLLWISRFLRVKQVGSPWV